MTKQELHKWTNDMKRITQDQKQWMLKCIVNTIESNPDHQELFLLEVLLAYYGSDIQIDQKIYIGTLEYLNKIYYED